MQWSPPNPARPRAYRRARKSPDPGVVATRLCMELQALTGTLDSGVHIEVLMKRLDIGPSTMAQALAFAGERDWISCTPETAALRILGRQEAMRHWPAPPPPGRRRRRKH